VINGNAISFIDDEATYSANFASNTRISGSSTYGSYRDASDDSPNHVQSGRFTLIKLASLPKNFEVDASSDAYGDSYTKALNSIGTVTARAQPAHGDESFERSGEVRCFVHTEGTYTDTENAAQIDKGSYTKFWAGSSGSPEVEIERDGPDGSLAYLQIDIYEPPYFHIDIDNSIFDEITGVSTLSIEGVGTITVKGSVSGADEGDAETSINISLP